MARNDDKERIVINVGEWEQEDDSKSGWGQFLIYDEDGEKFEISVPKDRYEDLDEDDPFQEGDELHLTEGGYDRWVLTALPNEEPDGGGGGRSSGRSGGGSRRGRSSSKSSKGSSRRGRSSSKKDDGDGGSKRGSNRKSRGSKSGGDPDVNQLIKMQEYMKISATCLQAVGLEELEESVNAVIDMAKHIDEELNG